MTALEESNQRVTDCIYKSLASNFGEDVVHIIFYHFRNQTNISAVDIPKRPEAFATFLVSMFGEQGSVFIKKVLTSDIQANFAIPRKDNYSLESAITAARRLTEQYDSDTGYFRDRL